MSTLAPLPCPEKPELLAGAPLGQYHCPYCGQMQIAGVPHFDSPPDDVAAFEAEYGYQWPFWQDEEGRWIYRDENGDRVVRDV